VAEAPHVSDNAPLFYAVALYSRDPSPPLARRNRRNTPLPLSPRATGTPLSSSHRVAPLPTRPPSSRSACTPPIKGCRRAPLSFLSPSSCFILRVKHAAPPYTSPCCRFSEPIIGASPKKSVDIVHPPPRSSRHRAAPDDLQCCLHFDKHLTGALLLPDLQVDASELSFDQTSVSASSRLRHCPQRNTTMLPHSPPHWRPTPLVSRAAILLAR
jgi:hypothetical protein